MEISKTQILGFLFFLVNCPNLFAKPATPARKDLGELNRSIFELQKISSYTWRTMDWVRKDKGYPGRSDPNCDTPIRLLYKSSAYNATTMHQHLTKIKNTLRPLLDATVFDYFDDKDIHRNVANKTLRGALTTLTKDIGTPVLILYTMGYRGSGNIKPDSAEITKKVKEYM
ncbi:Hypothetical predicted protein, partial [Paramuricea clavata]